MRHLRFLIFFLCFIPSLHAQKFPINKGILQSALDANAQSITNAGTISATNIGGFNIIPSDATADGGGSYSVPVVAGKTYYLDLMGGDGSVVNGADEYEISQTFVADGSSVLINAAGPDAPIDSKIYGPLQPIYGLVKGDGSQLTGIDFSAVSNGIVNATVLKASNIIPEDAVFADGGEIASYTLPTIDGVLYFFEKDGSEAVDNQDGAVTYNTSSSFIASGGVIIYSADTDQIGMPITSRVYAISNTIYGDFKGNFPQPEGFVQAANNGSDFSDVNATRQNLHAVVTDDTAGTLGLTESKVTLGYGSIGQTGSGDIQFAIDCGATSPYNSGPSFAHYIKGFNGSGQLITVNPVGSQFNYAFTNRVATVIPGVAQHVFSIGDGGGNIVLGYAISAPHAGNFGNDFGNQSYFFADFKNHKTGFPLWKSAVYQPNDVAYKFTVSGVSTAPVYNTLYTNNGAVWTVISNNISAGSGTIIAVSWQGAAPSSSGTLGKHSKSQGAGDSSITFSAASSFATWSWAFNADNLTGRLSINNAVSGTATLSSGTVTVNNTLVTANSRFILTPHGSTIAAVGVSAQSAGTSFTIKSSSGTDANTVDWVMFEPAP